MNNETKEIIEFLLNSVEKLSMAILTGDYDYRELHEINQEADIFLFELSRN